MESRGKRRVSVTGERVISAKGLAKRYDAFEAVKGIDFEVRSGEVFGLLGSNGAGKSSTMRMIGCVSRPTSGELRVLGMDPVKDGSRIRGRIGVCPQFDNLDPDLTVRENLYAYSRFFGIPRAKGRRRADELLEFFEIADKAHGKVAAMSGGMKRRLTIARALINNPEIVLLDEPTTGLDPQARHLVWERLHQLKRQGITLILTTHYMDEAEQLCDRLVIMRSGRFVAEGSPASLIRTYTQPEVVELRFASDDLRALAEKVDDLGRVEVLPDRLLIYTDRGNDVAARVRDRALGPSSVLVRRSGLEDAFLALTGRDAR
ncbi:ABC transporter ATP-binding protein [Streptomyces albospinus]|uniref:ABC transporter ATP-binding protein n=1 Tax=Streptomyces albospinus TaxID=285515 RepID=UPI001670EC8A|nr:ABC transporter ATP-binding protein [Streptomyces albospinus]